MLERRTLEASRNAASTKRAVRPRVDERYRALVECAPDAVVVTDAEGRIILVNSRAERLFGYSPGELVGRPFELLADPEARTIGDGLDLAGSRMDGSTFPIEVRSSPLETDRGDVVITAVRDITERRRAEEALRQSEDRFRGAFQFAAIGMALVAPDGRFLQVNDALCEIVGYSASELVDRGFQEITHPDDLEADLEYVRQLLAGEISTYQMEKRYFHRLGHVVWVLLSVSLVRASNGSPVHFVSQIQDISERKQAEEERDRLRDELHHAQKLDAIGQLAGGIAHDFNNTLTAIRGYGDLLAAALPEGDTLRRYADEIRKTAETGAALPRQLLAFGRRQPLAVEPLQLNQVVADACTLFEPLLGERIELVLEPGPDIVVAGDRVQLGQALLNLALNARDAMPEGGRLTVGTELRHLDVATAERRGAGGSDFAVISVGDTGIGMDAATKSRVFEPFFTTKPEGTGLGLATLYGIVHQSGGFITLESKPGDGSTFEICLPCEAVGPAGPEADGVGTVLVAEDEPAVRRLVRELLERGGHRVIEAATGAEALAVFERDRGAIDVLVTDLKMPGIDGLELARRIRADRPALPAIAISAYTEEPPDEDVVFLAKPFSSDELAQTVDRAMNLSREQAAQVSVLVADDHPPVLEAVTRVLENAGFRIAGTALDGQTALRRIVALEPDVALVDIRMSGLNGVEVTRRATELAPRTAVVLYTGLGDSELLRQALDAGARGFLLKDASLDELADALARVAGGDTHVASDLADTLVTPTTVAELPVLTPRERDVLKLLAEGMTNDGAAAALSISPETIQTHVRKAMAKLDADTRTAAVARALRLALIA